MANPGIDGRFLDQVGLGSLPADDKPAMLRHINQTLEMRVGRRLAAGMPSSVLAQFDDVVKSKDPKQIADWLKRHAPHYPQVVKEEMIRLRIEIKANAQQILGDSEPPS